MNDIFQFKSNSANKGQLGEIIAHKALMNKYPNWDIILWVKKILNGK